MKFQWFFEDQKIQVYRRKITQFDAVIARHRVATLHALISYEIRNPACEHIKVYTAVLTIEEERIIERACFFC